MVEEEPVEKIDEIFFLCSALLKRTMEPSLEIISAIVLPIKGSRGWPADKEGTLRAARTRDSSLEAAFTASARAFCSWSVWSPDNSMSENTSTMPLRGWNKPSGSRWDGERGEWDDGEKGDWDLQEPGEKGEWGLQEPSDEPHTKSRFWSKKNLKRKFEFWSENGDFKFLGLKSKFGRN